MTIEGHLAELERKHQAIEDELDAVKHKLSLDDLKVLELKRRKLQLKDEIQKIREGGSLH